MRDERGFGGNPARRISFIQVEQNVLTHVIEHTGVTLLDELAVGTVQTDIVKLGNTVRLGLRNTVGMTVGVAIDGSDEAVSNLGNGSGHRSKRELLGGTSLGSLSLLDVSGVGVVEGTEIGGNGQGAVNGGLQQR